MIYLNIIYNQKLGKMIWVLRTKLPLVVFAA